MSKPCTSYGSCHGTGLIKGVLNNPKDKLVCRCPVHPRNPRIPQYWPATGENGKTIFIRINGPAYKIRKVYL
jgi:hypothetical protein